MAVITVEKIVLNVNDIVDKISVRCSHMIIKIKKNYS